MHLIHLHICLPSQPPAHQLPNKIIDVRFAQSAEKPRGAQRMYDSAFLRHRRTVLCLTKQLHLSTYICLTLHDNANDAVYAIFCGRRTQGLTYAFGPVLKRVESCEEGPHILRTTSCELVRSLQCRSRRMIALRACSLLHFHVEFDAPHLHVVTPSNTNYWFRPITIQRHKNGADASHGSHFEDTGRLACFVVACLRL